MDNTYILRFIDSKDIRKHLNEIDYQFSVPEYAYLIWQCSSLTVEQRHREWHKLIDETDDCLIMSNPNREGWALHQTIKDYISFENRVVDKMKMSGEKAFYTVEWLEKPLYRRDDGWHGGNSCFETYDCAYASALEYAQDDDAKDDVEEFKVKKTFIDNNPNTSGVIEAVYSPDGMIKNIEFWGNTEGFWDEDDIDIWFYRFDQMWFDIPIPFKPGDIVCDCFDKTPFVITDTVPWSKKEHPSKHGSLYSDHSDMNASGYSYNKDTQTVLWNWASYLYLNLEYYTDKLRDGERVLSAYSLFKQDKINGDTLTKLCSIINAEMTAKKQYEAIDWYPNEYIEKQVGITGYMEE